VANSQITVVSSGLNRPHARLSTGKLMLHILSDQADARLFGLDLGDWSVLLGGSVLAALVLFLN
jgi:hypothetical protein